MRLPPWRTRSGRCSGLRLPPVPQASAGRAKGRCLSQGLEGHREPAARNWGEAGTRLICLAEPPENSPIVGSIRQTGMVEGSSGQPPDWVGSQGGQEERKERGCCRAPRTAAGSQSREPVGDLEYSRGGKERRQGQGRGPRNDKQGRRDVQVPNCWPIGATDVTLLPLCMECLARTSERGPFPTLVN